jgi:ADP-ribose pyrophosphatase YjhB (NUDIX family)
MDGQLQLSPWQRLRTRAFLLVSALRKRLTVGVRAVLLDGGKVLLVKHTYVPGWHFPGGGVEPGEPAEISAGREVIEETGFAVEGRPVLLGFYLNRGAGGARDHVAVYLWRDFRRERAFVPNFEIADCAWFELGALPADIDPGTARRLREITERLAAAAEW